MFKSGFVSIIGKTNVGKSTLLNILIKNKISITSSKTNTTLIQIMGVCNESDYQLVFFDNPGINWKNNFLTFKNIQDSDIILFVVDREYKDKDQKILNILNKYKSKIFLIINKIDILKNKMLIDKIIISYLTKFSFDEIIPLSCLKEKNLCILKQKILLYLDQKKPYFSKNFLTNITKKELISDLIREKVLLYINSEIPYFCRILVENIFLNEDLSLMNIDASIVVKKESHKKIIIGKHGSKIKQIGMDARKEISHIFKIKIFLNLYIKLNKKN
ncbi:MAG: GTPase [Candidatus Phytoplasma cynodontis]|nr:MAG: GTPase [Candidatus Phytoplasma cynodontis]